MIQLAHFIYAYLELSDIEQAKADGDLPELEMVVPTGGAGNIAGGLITAGGELELIHKYSLSGLKGGWRMYTATRGGQSQSFESKLIKPTGTVCFF